MVLVLTFNVDRNTRYAYWQNGVLFETNEVITAQQRDGRASFDSEAFIYVVSGIKQAEGFSKFLKDWRSKIVCQEVDTDVCIMEELAKVDGNAKVIKAAKKDMLNAPQPKKGGMILLGLGEDATGTPMSFASEKVVDSEVVRRVVGLDKSDIFDEPQDKIECDASTSSYICTTGIVPTPEHSTGSALTCLIGDAEKVCGIYLISKKDMVRDVNYFLRIDKYRDALDLPDPVEDVETTVSTEESQIQLMSSESFSATSTKSTTTTTRTTTTTTTTTHKPKTNTTKNTTTTATSQSTTPLLDDDYEETDLLPCTSTTVVPKFRKGKNAYYEDIDVATKKVLKEKEPDDEYRGNSIWAEAARLRKAGKGSCRSALLFGITTGLLVAF